MVYILMDSCVWLDLAKDDKKKSLLDVIHALKENKKIELIIPQIVRDEFNKNKDRVAEEGVRSLKAAIRRAGDAIHLVGNPRKKKSVFGELRDVELKVARMGESALESLNLVEDLFTKETIIPTSSTSLVKAAQRGVEKKAPFHRSKNSTSDAVLIESYGECIEQHNKPKDRFLFITHNKNDFSDPKDDRLPHADLASFFSDNKSGYSINLAASLKKIAPRLVTRTMMEAEFEFIPRTYGEIRKAEDELEAKIWYDRHQQWLQNIQAGRHKIVETSEYKKDPSTTPRYIYEGARKAAQEFEQEFGREKLGPWTKFEWGMINGKLSALRWVIGEDWDNLHT